MTTFTVQGFSRVLDYQTGTYSGFATAKLKFVRPDGADSFVHHYQGLDEEFGPVGMTQVRDFTSHSALLTRPGATYELQVQNFHMERLIYELDWGDGKTTYVHAFFQPMSGEEFIFGMSGDALPALTGLAGFASLMAGAKRWIGEGPYESGQEIPLTDFQNLTTTQNDKVVARVGQSLMWDAGIGADTLTGADGDDTLLGGDGADKITTGGGANLAFGGEGADILTGSANGTFNELMGGAGNDRITSASELGAIVNGGAGADRIALGAGVLSGEFWSAHNHANGGSGDDTITGAEAADWAYGDWGNDSLSGGGGTDGLMGGRGDDTLAGGADSDQLTGGAGNDALDGGAGNDYLTGGLGADQMTGGTEADSFAFRTADESTVAASDIITFFELGLDKIDLSMMDANTAADGDQTFVWRGSAAFTARGQLRVVESGGDSIVTGNLTGSTAADFRIVIDGVTGLTETDFLL